MKQKLLTRLILGAFAGVAAVSAHAGQIQASSTSIAREVITSDAQPIIAPSVSYRFIGDVDARVQAQTFQVQLTLGDSALWGTLPGTLANAISVTDGVSGVIWDQNAATGATRYTVTAINKSTDNKTLWVTFTVYQNAANLLKQPIISFNVTSNTINAVAGSNVSASRAPVINLKTLVGDLPGDFAASGKCVDVKTLTASVKHYVALSNPATIAGVGNGVEDEHTRAGATNSATIITFPTNVRVAVTSSVGNARVNTGTGSLSFAGTPSAVAPAFDSWTGATTVVNLGSVSFVQNAVGYDADLSNQYLLSGATDGGGANAAGLDAVGATAARVLGDVEVEDVDVVVTASNGFVPNGLLWLDTVVTCTAGVGIVSGGGVATPITALNAAGPITLTVGTAQVNAAFGATGTAPVYVCYGNGTATTPIPLSAFSAVATLDKANPGGFNAEQNNICNGSLYSLGGGVKVDVRNYANSAMTAATGWMSVIRVINPHETRTVDVWGQMIHADGTYGAWGKLTDLAPRAVLNLTSADVDALLVNAPASTANGPATSQNLSRGGSRLRITSNAATSLRVQNYLYNPASENFIEASSTQGVDYDGPFGPMLDRAPVGENQYMDQDAYKGLNGK
jgi:hypothetical protein